MQMWKKFAGNQNQFYRSVNKTLLLKEQTWSRSKHVRRDEGFLSLAQIADFTMSLSEIYMLINVRIGLFTGRNTHA